MQAVGMPGRHQFRFMEYLLFGMDEFNPLPRSETYTNLAYAFHGWDFSLGESFIPQTLLPQAIKEKHQDWYGHVLCGAPRADQFNHYEYPIPGAKPIKMIWTDTPCWSACWNHGHLFEDALLDEDIEFVLVQHPWMENNTLWADIILPTATTLECYDIGNDNVNGQYSCLYVQENAVDFQGEATSDFDAVVRVAKAMERLFPERYEGLVEEYTQGMTQEEHLEYGFEHCGAPEELSWEQLKDQDFWMSPTRDGWETETAGLLDFARDPEHNKLSTPTGKIEIYSQTLAAKFPDDKIRAPYPQWIESGDGHDERIGGERAKSYPFLLMSNHPRWRVHANNDDNTWMREFETCKIEGPDGYKYEPIWINPVDAVKVNVKDGDIVKMYNERGAVLGAIRISERIIPGAIYQDHGARVDSIVIGEFDRAGANNLICPSNTTSKNAPGEVTNSFLVNIDKVDVFELAKQYPEAFSKVYDKDTGQIAETVIITDEEA